MSIEGALMVLLWIVVVFAAAWLAHWIITTYLPEPVRTPALLIVGVILLIIVVLAIVRGVPGIRIGISAPVIRLG
jgi:glucose-6-phosphate-specific signal transduction histidine kinase